MKLRTELSAGVVRLDGVLLAIDTSAGTSVALIDRERGVLAERGSADTRGHAETIGRFLAEVFAEAGVEPRELAGVAVGMGPGPFTGLRVGIAAARAYAFGIGRPVLPVPSHDAVAFAEARAGETSPIIVVTDARRREVAWSVYAAPDAEGLPVRIAGPELAAANAELPGSVDAIASESPGNAPADGAAPAARRIDAREISAGAIGLLAAELEAQGRPLGPSEPLYLRAPDVTLSTPKRVS